MSYAYIKPIAQHGGMYFVEIIKMSPDDSVPPRPTPGPTPPGPGDPHPAFPIWGPPGFGPGAGFPDRPGYPTIPGGGGGGGGGGVPEGSKVVVLSPVPEGETPPAAPPADASVMKVNMGPGTLPTYAWVAPYAQTQP